MNEHTSQYIDLTEEFSQNSAEAQDEMEQQYKDKEYLRTLLKELLVEEVDPIIQLAIEAYELRKKNAERAKEFTIKRKVAVKR